MSISSKDFPDRIIEPLDLESLFDALKYDEHGLVSVIAQDAKTQQVLMLAFADRAALRLSIETGLMHYYSRSRKRLWKKGEDSGHLQKLCEMRIDCDGDAILALVEQTGGACHLGFASCFSFKIGDASKIEVVGEKRFDPLHVYKLRIDKN